MSRKGESSWQRLIQLIGAHMHESPDDDRCDRAHRTLCGHLTQNAPHVWASLKLGLPPKSTVVDAAISARGTVGILAVEPSFPGFANLRLFTWSWLGGMRNRNLDYSMGEHEAYERNYPNARVFFTEGSEEPIVKTNCGDILWGDDEPVRIRDGAESLTCWVEDGRNQIAYLCGGMYVQHTEADLLDRTEMSSRVRWIGAFGGSLLRIVSERNYDVLRWRDARFSLPDAREFVEPSTICFQDGTFSFVAAGSRARVFFWNGRTLTCHEVPDGAKICRTDNRLFAVRLLGSYSQVFEFTPSGFREIAITQDGMGVDHPTVFLFPDGALVLSNVPSMDPGSSLRKTVVWDPPKDGRYGRSRDESEVCQWDFRMARFHNYLGLERPVRHEAVFVCEIAGTGDDAVNSRVFPLYDYSASKSFERLTEVSDDLGNSVMSWAFADGTFHVIRYDLLA